MKIKLRNLFFLLLILSGVLAIIYLIYAVEKEKANTVKKPRAKAQPRKRNTRKK